MTEKHRITHRKNDRNRQKKYCTKHRSAGLPKKLIRVCREAFQTASMQTNKQTNKQTGKLHIRTNNINKHHNKNNRQTNKQTNSEQTTDHRPQTTLIYNSTVLSKYDFSLTLHISQNKHGFTASTVSSKMNLPGGSLQKIIETFIYFCHFKVFAFLLISKSSVFRWKKQIQGKKIAENGRYIFKWSLRIRAQFLRAAKQRILLSNIRQTTSQMHTFCMKV